ncbi:Gmad2 immunoglobulin-like domain-containing protein [Candidatus Poseidoniales archaeon]|nr:Gmad2 immunoglobulin-like domain-containing protein [Candidatus Poseidoniales archaeon]MDA8818408.1 Gmad2 immunoglobulin-like domain-containing protein [Candidatus Poseidoniales archaeon]MDA8838803.1 Gmad2 immunoglobulin-like domain-containing protein [Candidatus Poseidoniales archaeon]
MERKRLVNLVLWPVALLVLNSLWMSVAGGVAPYEINDVDQAIETRTVELDSVFGFSKEMPAEMEVEFTGVSVDDGTVSWIIRDASNSVIAEWSGLLSEGAPNWSGALEPGTYTVETTVDEGIVAEQVLQIQPFESYRLEGHIILSISLFLVAFGEVFIRQKAEVFMAKRAKSNPVRTEKSPFKPLRTGMPEEDLSLDEDGPWRSPIGR